MADSGANSGGLTEPLTEREQEILTCLGEGLSNREIANRLHLAHQTVKWYNSQLYSKLGVGSREEAVERAQAFGLLATPLEVGGADGKHNLSVQPTPFVGRQRELAELGTLLDEPNIRLLTILAPGGMGKTRLSIEAARGQIGRYADGVYFVPLAPLSAPGDIVTTIAEIIGMAFYGEKSPSQQLTDFLQDRSMLLVLDNFEHLLEGTPLVTVLIQTAPQVTVLATSREKLNLRGETVYSLRGLEFPTWETPEDALEYDAVKLFVQRVQRIRPDFELRSTDLDFLARICRLTEGMPLGIELAAGWVDALSLEQIALELQQGIDILETELRDVPERHRSIRASFERSWHRLSDDEQAIFARLSVFRGGFARPAAEAVAGANARHLRALAQKALVQIDSSERYTVHELLRQFGASKLAETDDLPAVQARHAGFFADFMAQRKQDMKTDRDLKALDLMDADFENVRLAWLHTVEHEAWAQFPKFLHSLWFYCDLRSRSHDVIGLFEHAIEALQSAAPLSEAHLALGRVKAWIGWFYNDAGFPSKGRSVCKEAIHILEQYDSVEDLIFAHHSVSLFAMFSADMPTARTSTLKSIELAQQSEDPFWEARCLEFLSGVKVLENDDDAWDEVQQMRTQFEAIGNQFMLSRVYVLESVILIRRRDLAQAKRLMLQAADLAAPFKTAYHSADSFLWLGAIAIHQEDYDEARRYLYECLRLFWDAGYTHFAVMPMMLAALMLIHVGDAEKSLEIASCLSANPSSYSHPLGWVGWDLTVEGLLGDLEAQLEPEQFAAAWARGQERELNGLIVESLAEMRDD